MGNGDWGVGNGEGKTSTFDSHAFPEGYVAGDVFGGGERRGIVPGRVLVNLTGHFQVVIAGGAFPGAFGVSGTGPKKFLVQGIGRKVMIAFDDNRIWALGNDLIIPNGAGHGGILIGGSSETER